MCQGIFGFILSSAKIGWYFLWPLELGSRMLLNVWLLVRFTFNSKQQGSFNFIILFFQRKGKWHFSPLLKLAMLSNIRLFIKYKFNNIVGESLTRKIYLSHCGCWETARNVN
jgi:hypothetical protein